MLETLWLIFSWWLTSVVAQDLWTRVINRLQNPEQARRLVSNVYAKSSIRPGRAWGRWISDDANWNILIRCTHTDTAPADRAALATALELQLDQTPSFVSTILGRPTDNRRKAEALVDATIEMLIPSLDPSLAIAVTSHKTHQHLAKISATLQLTNDPESRYARLPPPAGRAIRQLAEIQTEAASRLLDALTGPAHPRQTVRALTDDPPNWLQTAHALAWVVLGEVASAHDDPKTASRVFEKSADLGYGISEHLGKAAIAARASGDPERAHSIAERLATSDTPANIKNFVSAVLSNDTERLLAFSSDEIPWDPIVTKAAGESILVSNQPDSQKRAIGFYQQVVAQNPELSWFAIRLADLMVEQTLKGRQGHGWQIRRDATDIALAARDQRRLWRGDSTIALAVACRAAAIDDLWQDILKIGLPQPEGDAYEEEADDPIIQRYVIEATIRLGDLDRAQLLLETVQIPLHRHMLAGDIALAQGNADEAKQQYYRAWPFVEEEQDRLAIWSALAANGHDLPDASLLESRDDIASNLIRAQHKIQTGDTQAGTALLRRWRHTSPEAVHGLVMVYVRSGNIDQAIDELVSAASRFEEAKFLVYAGQICLDNGEPQRGRTYAERALVMGPPSQRANIAAQEVLINAAQSVSDWSDMAVQVRSLIEKHGATATRRWLLVGALFNDGRHHEAWDALTAAPALTPGSEERARVWIDLHSRYNPGQETATRILAYAEQYEYSPDFDAAAINHYIFMSINIDLPQPLVDQWRARIGRFLHNNPQNQSFFTVELPKSVEGMTEALRNILEPGTDTFDEVRIQAAAGRAAVGMLAAYAGKPYAATLIQRGPGCLPIATWHTQHQIDELRSAVEAVDGPVAVDTSSLFVLSLISDEWELVKSHFSRMSFSNPGRTDIAHTVATYSRQISGMLGWDRKAKIPRVYEISEDEQAQWSQHAEWMLDRAQHLDLFSRTVLTNIFSEPHQDEWDERFLPWLAALDYAIEQGVPLYADDIALRSLARERGIPTFGTTSLLEALVNKGALHRIKFSSYMDELRFNYCVDLPLDVHSLARVAERENWRSGASAFIFSRPIVWSTAQQTISAWRSLCSQAIRRDPKYLPGWLYQAVRGACESRRDHERGYTAAALMLMALTISGVDRLLLSDLLVATRAAVQSLDAGDPLIPFTRLTLDLMSNGQDLQFAARAVLSLTENLTEEDKETVRTVVFSA